MFSEISLTFWEMDDGYFYYHSRTQLIILCVLFSTESFTTEDCIIIQSILEKLE